MDGLEALRPARPDEVARFAARHGYVWLPGLLETESVRALARRVEQAWRAASGDRLVLHRAVLPAPELDRIRRHPALLGALREILGRCLPERGDVIRYVEPADPPTPPHQDASYLRGELRIWSAWIPLCDCPLERGPVAVWPGSHGLGLLPHGEAGLRADVAAGARWAASDLACGDVVLMNALTVHEALPNRSEGPRISIDCRYGAERSAG